jgi:hypothetical protein
VGVPSSACEPSLAIAPSSVSILDSSLDDDSEDENPPPLANIPPDDSFEPEQAPVPLLPRWVRSKINMGPFLVGSLLYLTHTHPDLSFVVVLVARYMKTPHEIHWKAAKRILRYVRGTVQFGIHYSSGGTPLLVGFTDSDWAGDPDDRKSTIGYVFSLGSGPVTWACKKQQAIALSSAEAEYRATVNASQEALWLRQILSEFGFQHQHPTRLWCDNQSAIKLAKDPVQHQRSKHIELHMHFIRKLIHDQVIEVLFCPTEDQVADIFTKSLTEAKFSKLRSMLGVQEAVIKGG